MAGPLKLLAGWRILFLVAMCQLMVVRALAAEQFVVVVVEPPGPDLVAGAVYQSDEFIFVPSDVKAVLFGEDGSSYLIEGRDAVRASRSGLGPYRIEAERDRPQGLLQRVFGLTGLEEVAAASRKVPKGEPAAAPDGDLADRLALIVEFLGKLETSKYCLIDGTLVLRRLDDRFLDNVHIDLDGALFDRKWRPGLSSVRLANLDLDEGQPTPAEISTKSTKNRITVERLPKEALGEGAFAAAAALADRGCTVQALMMAEDTAGQ